jgi:uncharacterized protein YgbK (DUF1537 family)
MALEADPSQRWVLSLADDLTGALEAGAKFAECGIRARVTTELELRSHPDVPVLVVDTETRHAHPEEAFSRTKQFLSGALRFNPWLIYKKTDSTLRGNIAAELRAALEVMPSRSMVYAPAYPELGRTVRQGRLFVRGEPVHETEFANDSLNPVRECDLREMLAGLPVQIEDGETSRDIVAVAARILTENQPPVAVGPAALAGALAGLLATPHSDMVRARPCITRCLVVNGSRHPASAAQVALARSAGCFTDGWELFEARADGVGEYAFRVGEMVRRRFERERFDGLMVCGGDTAVAIHRALAAPAFEPLREIMPGVPLSRCGDLFWITKAGGFGTEDTLCRIRQTIGQWRQLASR